MSQRLGPLIPALQKLHPDLHGVGRCRTRQHLSSNHPGGGSDVAARYCGSWRFGYCARTGHAYEDQGASALDDVDGVVDVVVSGMWMSTQCLHPTYTTVDNSGNQAIPAARTVFIADTGKPTLELLGLSTLT